MNSEIVADLLGPPGLSDNQQLMISVSVADTRIFANIEDALIKQHPRIQSGREVKDKEIVIATSRNRTEDHLVKAEARRGVAKLITEKTVKYHAKRLRLRPRPRARS